MSLSFEIRDITLRSARLRYNDEARRFTLLLHVENEVQSFTVHCNRKFDRLKVLLTPFVTSLVANN